MESSESLKQLHNNEEYVKAFNLQPPARLANLLKYIQLGQELSVVDFACGNGMLMELIAPQVKSYTGVDFSELFIKAANKKKQKLSIRNVEFICSDMNEFCQIHRNSFDIGFAMDFSEHVYDMELLEILQNIRRSLKPAGKLYLHTPNAEFFLERMKSKNFIVKQFPEHVAVRTSEHNVSILQEAGFNLERVCLLPHYNILRFIHPLSYFPVLGKYLKARIFIEATA